jgi:hypothetical protein
LADIRCNPPRPAPAIGDQVTLQGLFLEIDVCERLPWSRTTKQASCFSQTMAAGSGQLFANETYWSDVRQARLISVRLEFSLFQLRSLFQPSPDH